MNARTQNEKKFRHWEELPEGGKTLLVGCGGTSRLRARYLKEVDTQEMTLRFWQEIYDDQGKLIEVHEKYPMDKGHQKV